MLTAHQVHFEMIVTFLASLTGAWGPRPTPTVLTRSAFVTADESRERDDVQRAPEIYDFAKMTEAEAKRLDGKRITVRARLRVDRDLQLGGSETWYCDCAGGARWVNFREKDVPTGEQAKKEILLEGKFSFRPANPQTQDAPIFCLDNAKIIKP